MERERVVQTAKEMHQLGREYARNLGVGDCVVLTGPLGAGKTQFVQGLAEGLGYGGEVTSPTFSLLHEYRGGREALFHLDFYRIEHASELLDLGWDELLEEGVVVAEWGARFPELLPAKSRWITLTHEGETGRKVVLGARASSK